MSLKQTIEACIDVPFMDLRNISALMMKYCPYVMPETIVVISLCHKSYTNQGEIISSFKKHRMTYEDFKLILTKKSQLIKNIFDSGLAVVDLIDKKTKHRYFRSRGNFNDFTLFTQTFTGC